jgi:NADPH-dependent 2,4-dienoyl-CoA reductase/sulfur reductase-like enzyme/rhodanese-related sulfurtransferase
MSKEGEVAVNKRILIVGGVAAGATAAARARRLDEWAEITIVEKGPYVSFANCGLPYRISRDIAKRSQLILQTAEGFEARYRVKVLLETEAIGIDREARLLKVRGPGGERELPYDSLILAQGGTPFVPPMEGSGAPHVFRLWTIPDMDAIEACLERDKPASAVVIGGGFIGLEAAEAFLKRGLAVTIVELTPHLMPPADPEFGVLIGKAFEEAGARVLCGRSVKKIDAAATTVLLDDGSLVPAGIVLVSAGVRPNTELAKAAGLDIGPSGGLAVDDGLRTADPHIWAAGDMIEVSRLVDGKKVRVPLAGPANREGRIAASNALGGNLRFRGALGSSVFKAADYTFAMTGLAEKAAREAGFETGAVVIHKGNHVSYMPGYEELSLKLVYDRKDGRILGAEAFGKADVEKRIDVVATAIMGGLGVHDLAELDLAYAPPYNSANDALNMAAFAAQNELSGYSPTVGAAEAARLSASGEALVLDVRTRGEFAKGRAAGALNVPLDELRDRLEELPRDRPLLIASKAGFEGHVALRQLVQAGFRGLRYISGGMNSMRLEKAYRQEIDV